MKIVGNKIIFKSKGPHFLKERDNRKCNTIRKIIDPIEINCFKESRNKLKIIRIWSLLGYFERELTDITEWEGYYIFSWKPI